MAKKTTKKKSTRKVASADPYAPDPKLKFTFGLWTVSNPGADPFGLPVREKLTPVESAKLLGEVGAYGVNFHDNDLIPIDATPEEAAQIKKDFKKALKDNGLKVPMATTNLFTDPTFKDGAFTSNDANVRAYAIQKTMQSMDLGAEFGAKIYVFWGGREGAESDATKCPIEATKRFREAINYLCEYSIAQGYKYKFAFEAKPNEPRGHIYFPITSSYLAFIESLDHPDMCGVNPEYAHETMAGVNFVHQIGAALEAKKLFHIDLNDQVIGRYDQDFRFGSVNLKDHFFLVKLLEDNKYNGPRHFDSHAYRQSDYKDVKAFAAGSMKNYMILKEKAEQWNADKEIQALVKEINVENAALSKLTKRFSATSCKKLLATDFDRIEMGKKGLPYERLDQLTMEIIMGTR